MPNFKTHIDVEARIAVLANMVKQGIQIAANPDYEFDLVEAVAWGGVGCVAGCAADIFEPAVHRIHRSTFHSLATLVLILYALHGKHSKEFTPDQRSYAGLFGYPYVSHLALDFLTKAGPPLI